MVLRTLRAMALGGMRDHIGGGFHRYSVDARLARAALREDAVRPGAARAAPMLEAAQVSGDPFYAEVAEDTLLYVMREMTDSRRRRSIRPRMPTASRRKRPTSPTAHKKEGAFYLWRADEVDALLGDDAAVVKLRFGIEPDGNAPQDPQQEFTGKNLLYVARVDRRHRQARRQVARGGRGNR